MVYSEPGTTRFARYTPSRIPVEGVTPCATSLDYTPVELIRPPYHEIKSIEKEIYTEYKNLKMDGFKPEFIVMSKWLYEKFAAYYGISFKGIFGLRVLPVNSDDLYFDIVTDDPLNHFINTWGKNA